MVCRSDQTSPTGSVWRLASAQHGVVARRQLLELGLGRRSIAHRVAVGRLHAVRRGVYSVGRPELTRSGHWMAALLSCPEGAVLSHESAAALLGIEDLERITVITLPPPRRSRRRDVRIHCRKLMPEDHGEADGIPVTSPARTLIDLATLADERRLEAAVNTADQHDLIDPESLRAVLAERQGVPGVPALRRLLDLREFRLTDSELERRLLRLLRRSGLPLPQTGVRVGSFTIDFLWPDLGLVVETDGLRYHRTPGQQTRDRRRDQALTARGLTVLRFTHAQVARRPDEVVGVLREVAGRLA